jgi:hypothetical protein
MAVKRRGTVARPGVHKNALTGKDEVITWEELKRAVQFQNRIPLVLSHPLTGYINPDERIGTVTQSVNEKEKKIDGEFWFFDEPECWDKIPPELKRKIIGGSEIPLSAGYKVGAIVDGRQTSRQYDHIALDVTNPMQDVGITEGDVRIEETPTIEGENNTTDATKKTIPVTEPYNPIELGIMIGELKAEVKALREQLNTKPAVEEPTEETRPEPEAIPTQAPPKPKTVIPQGSAEENDGLEEDGVFRFTG